MVRCMLADSGLPKFLWGELMFTAAFLSNRAPYSAIGMQSPYKMLHGREPDLRLLRVIGARAFVHVEMHTKKLNVRAVEGRFVGYSSNSKSYRVYILGTRRIVESGNVVFIETPSRLLPSPAEESSVQVSGNEGVSNDNDHNYATDDDFLCDLRDHTSLTHLTPGPSADHVTASGRIKNPQVAEPLERISEVTRRDTLQDISSELPQDDSFSGEAPHVLPPAHCLMKIWKGLWRMATSTRRRCNRLLDYLPSCNMGTYVAK